MAEERRDEDQIDWPVAVHPIGQTEIPARRVQRVRHGMSVLLTGASKHLIHDVYSSPLGPHADDEIGIRNR
jgi:hypothetical protein